MVPFLNIAQLKKSFKKGVPVVNIQSLAIEKGQIVAIIGESGSGKTTLMRLIAGLETPSTGKIAIANVVVNDTTIFTSPERRKVGFVFQDYALFPHLTVRENINYGLSKKENASTRVQEVLKLVALTGYENRYPYQLSGGQQQRVALARALAPKPTLLILDEPFSNLDTSLKLQLRNEVFSILKNTGVTALFVTHDIDDAIAMADEIVVLKKGEIIQKGTAEKIYKTPATLDIATLFGSWIELSETALRSFDFPLQKGTCYAIKQNDFEVNKPCPYIADGKIVKSAFKAGNYVNTVQVSEGVVINCISEKKLQGTIKIGFEQKALLAFQKEK